MARPPVPRVGRKDARTRGDAEHLSAGERQVLMMIARGESLSQCLDRLARFIEAEAEGMRASILLLDPSRSALLHGAAPSLPPEYVAAIDGSAIGPAEGSCGTAAFLGEPVFVQDIAIDPRWARYRSHALPHGLRACWSTPVRDPVRGVLGTFALYYDEPALPEPPHLRLIELATDLAAVAISRDLDRAERDVLRLRQQEASKGAAAAELALAREALRRRMWFEHGFEPAFVLDQDWRIIEANPAFLDLLGREAKDVLGHEAREFEPRPSCDPSDPGQGPPPAAEGTIVTTVRRADGTEVEVEVSHTATTWEGRTEIYCVCRDVTRRNAAERAIRESLDRFRLPFQRTSVAMALAGPEGQIVEVNDAMCTLLGRDRFTLTASNLLEITHPDDRGATSACLEGLLSGGAASARLTKRFVRADGATVSADVSATLLRDEEGRPRSLVIHVVDITERTLLEEQLRHAQRIESLGRLAAGVAHDFNNLLTVINSYAELGKAALPAGHPVAEMLAQIGAAGRRGGSLTQQLLSFGRRQLARRGPLDLGAVVSGLETMLHRLLGERVRLDVAVEPGLPGVVADAGEIEQVVMNLAVNARDAMPEGGRLEIAVASRRLRDDPELPDGDYLVLRVADTGVGIEAETRHAIFEPFFTTKPSGSGTGLGLATVDAIVRGCKGVVRLESEVGRGTTFEVVLPVCDAAPESAPAESRARDVPTGHETILVVEDDAIVRELIRRILEAEGYAVITAADGDEALAHCASSRGELALVITDVVLPNMSGVELAERLRESGVSAVLFTSGYAPELARLEETAAFLAKPFTSEGLARAVRDLLDASS